VDLTTIAVVFGSIFIVELPDKTFIAALVLSTRYKPLAVWIGVGLAFGVQTLVAVTVGFLATLLPEQLVQGVAIAIFLLGAFVLFRTAPGADAAEKEQEEEFAAKSTENRSFFNAAVASFLILFAAEWGDLSQLLTISFVGRYDDHVSVFIGAWSALLVVSGLAVLVGRVLLRYMRLAVLHYDQPAVPTELDPGMTFTIEPMSHLGALDYEIWDDDWTVATQDKTRTAQFEHTLVVTEDGCRMSLKAPLHASSTGGLFRLHARHPHGLFDRHGQPVFSCQGSPLLGRLRRRRRLLLPHRFRLREVLRLSRRHHRL
jgi:putative Ca2+/H+ antiporter (TMEM165/GDT1 family)